IVRTVSMECASALYPLHLSPHTSQGGHSLNSQGGSGAHAPQSNPRNKHRDFEHQSTPPLGPLYHQKNYPYRLSAGWIPTTSPEHVGIGRATAASNALHTAASPSAGRPPTGVTTSNSATPTIRRPKL